MNALSEQLVFLQLGASLMLLLMGLGVAVYVPIVDRWSKRFFIAFFGILVLYGALILAETLMQASPGSGTALLIIYYFDTLSMAFLFFLMTAYLLHCSGEDLRKSGLLRAEGILLAAVFIMMNLTLLTPWFYYYTPGNLFAPGPLYVLLAGCILGMILVPLAGVLRRKKRLSAKYYSAFLIGLIPIAIGTIPVVLTASFILFGSGIVICAATMYVIILSDQIEQNARQQQEIASQRANVMVLQMRPHFIYNTLMGIYSLCNQDPQKARQVIMDFTNYLRKNFNAVASDNMIPFSAELEHTRAYLAVEQAQLEDLLVVEYDTEYTNFRLPPLTLQPIAENAVKHGLNPDAGPLQIMIRTRHTDACEEILVEDNGPGFSLSESDRPQTALDNIRERLEMMCGGSLDIQPRDGGGTTVKISIPAARDSAD